MRTNTPWTHLTCADQGTVVVQGPQVRPGQRQESVQFVEVIPEPGPSKDRSDDDVAERMANEAGKREIIQVSVTPQTSWWTSACWRH